MLLLLLLLCVVVDVDLSVYLSGWSNGTPKEIYSRAELIKEFDIHRIIKSPAVFDVNKLRWMNAQHIRSLSLESIQEHILPMLTTTAPARVASSVSSGSVVSEQTAISTDPLLSLTSIPPVDGNTPVVVSTSTENTSIESRSIEQLSQYPIFDSSISSYLTRRGESSDSGVVSETDGVFDEFFALAAKLCKRDMTVLTDARQIVHNCLFYDLRKVLQHNGSENDEARFLFHSERGKQLAELLVSDYHSGKMPRGTESNFSSAQLWKSYVHGLESVVGYKGKDLYHAIRLFITGRMTGPEVADQLRLLALVGNSPPVTIASSAAAVCGETSKVAAAAAAGSAAASTSATYAFFMNPVYCISNVVVLRDRIDMLAQLLKHGFTAK